ncbi:MAG: bifunctional DNA-formamidopyrimidine glycosylase/DNA-(apurinic or apyrimidinic site) lyase [Candidatus Omnitrophica bacterium]|nr:bifunctional DNA-formamidopyrimidine glycosylase/DNA-(apurinic or apyrimidinic site) lyase [Candidatus Omnitrophota bacterium]MDD5670169.1 bifunctional DNA-formamidopyrimidine glycosylase/DNA-(apurinic or apyrimidinic site) lyase [Candidatus Omnitrophota bacterium]
MPELPEVETIIRDLRSHGLTGRRIARVEVHWQKTIAIPDAKSFAAWLRNKKILAVSRRAKFIVLKLSGGATCLVHLRMTGRLYFTSGGQPVVPDSHVHVILHLDDGRRLNFRDPRKFGRWYLLQTPESILKNLGPEPLDRYFTAAVLRRRLARHDRQLKPLLLDQTFVAGLGNIYADEALWLAKIHPARKSGTLRTGEISKLFRAIKKVLTAGIRNLGTSLGTASTNYYSIGGRRGRNQDALQVFRRQGQPCPRCGTKIERLVIAQRSTHLCPQCQK